MGFPSLHGNPSYPPNNSNWSHLEAQCFTLRLSHCFAKLIRPHYDGNHGQYLVLNERLRKRSKLLCRFGVFCQYIPLKPYLQGNIRFAGIFVYRFSWGHWITESENWFWERKVVVVYCEGSGWRFGLLYGVSCWLHYTVHKIISLLIFTWQ
jgi:hypothetical protein